MNEEEEERLRILEEAVLGLAARVRALEDGWQVVGDAARRATKQLEGLRT